MDSAVLASIIAGLSMLFGGYLTFRANRAKDRVDAGQRMIDQHQEDIVSLRVRVATLENAARIQGDYIGQLRRHINDGEPPPPPPWPNGLIT